jgi:DNA-binding winged helix-turn-helix (wHTH) protein
LRYLFEEFELDTDRRELRRGTNLVAVEPQVFDLLVHLIQHRDRVVSKDDLLASVWQGRAISDSALFNRINAARSAIGDTGERQRLIKTLPRRGLRFVGAVREEGRSPAKAGSQKPSLAIADKPSIAVLPFVNLSGDPEQDYFIDGVVEDIITALSRNRAFFVIARNSSFTYKGKPVDTKQVARDGGRTVGMGMAGGIVAAQVVATHGPHYTKTMARNSASVTCWKVACASRAIVCA